MANDSVKQFWDDPQGDGLKIQGSGLNECSFCSYCIQDFIPPDCNRKQNKTQPKHPERRRKKNMMNNSIRLQASWCCVYNSDIILWAGELASAYVLVPCPSFATSPSLPLAVIPGLRLVPWKLMAVRLFKFSEIKIFRSLLLVIFWDTFWNSPAESL